MERVPGQLGCLILNEEGAVLSSSGDLENDENTASIIMNLISLTSYVDKLAFGDETFKTLTIIYDNHCYIIVLSNRKFHIIKRANIIDDVPFA